MIFVETSLFTRRIVQLMDDNVYRELQEHLAVHPEAGSLIIGSGGVRKIRWRGSNRGKRGGSRLIYYWDNGNQILMLYVYLKNERENLTPEQVSMMREVAKEFKNEQEEL
ncbi:MAG: type II toxin-antitoxin system RelE/ParE family toxin [Kiritimatiellae bacterium]|nr:type II toxin-antitoxin system RelE/ParE family toxin [Kiritimatiellia bacterium]